MFGWNALEGGGLKAGTWNSLTERSLKDRGKNADQIIQQELEKEV